MITSLITLKSKGYKFNYTEIWGTKSSITLKSEVYRVKKNWYQNDLKFNNTEIRVQYHWNQRYTKLKTTDIRMIKRPTTALKVTSVALSTSSSLWWSWSRGTHLAAIPHCLLHHPPPLSLSLSPFPTHPTISSASPPPPLSLSLPNPSNYQQRLPPSPSFSTDDGRNGRTTTGRQAGRQTGN